MLVVATCQIDEQELATALQGLEEEITPDRLHELMLSIDADGSGEIDFGEFLGVRGRESSCAVGTILSCS